MTEIQGADDLNKLQQAMGQMSTAGVAKFKSRVTYFVALAIKGVIQPYKPKSTPIKWASRKQRAWYFWARKQAGLPAKYTRGSDPWSQRLQQSWTVRRGQGEATLGSRATYAPYVASDEFQTEQHAATGFTTDKQAAEQVVNSGVMDKIIAAQIKAMMDEAFRGL